MREPMVKRAVTFVDGQNLFHCAKKAFGHRHPNYDVVALSRAVCEAQGWDLNHVRFYTGIPTAVDAPFWHHFWAGKLAVMGRDPMVRVFTRHLRYRTRQVMLPDGSQYTYRSGEEKGIDVRICLDIMALTHQRAFDVGVIFSQDEDLSEVADEIRVVARQQGRWIKLACAFPFNPDHKRRRGINKTDWIRIEQPVYDACLDQRDYRAKPAEVKTP